MALLYGDVVLWGWWQMTSLPTMEQTKTLSDTRAGRSPICISVTVRPGSGTVEEHHVKTRQALELKSVLLNKISLLSSNYWVIATSLFLWSDQDSSLLPGIEMFPVMTCLAFLIQSDPILALLDRTTKLQIFFSFLWRALLVTVFHWFLVRGVHSGNCNGPKFR